MLYIPESVEQEDPNLAYNYYYNRPEKELQKHIPSHVMNSGMSMNLNTSTEHLADSRYQQNFQSPAAHAPYPVSGVSNNPPNQNQMNRYNNPNQLYYNRQPNMAMPPITQPLPSASGVNNIGNQRNMINNMPPINGNRPPQMSMPANRVNTASSIPPQQSPTRIPSMPTANINALRQMPMNNLGPYSNPNDLLSMLTKGSTPHNPQPGSSMMVNQSMDMKDMSQYDIGEHGPDNRHEHGEVGNPMLKGFNANGEYGLSHEEYPPLSYTKDSTQLLPMEHSDRYSDSSLEHEALLPLHYNMMHHHSPSHYMLQQTGQTQPPSQTGQPPALGQGQTPAQTQAQNPSQSQAGQTQPQLQVQRRQRQRQGQAQPASAQQPQTQPQTQPQPPNQGQSLPQAQPQGHALPSAQSGPSPLAGLTNNPTPQSTPQTPYLPQTLANLSNSNQQGLLPLPQNNNLSQPPISLQRHQKQIKTTSDRFGLLGLLRVIRMTEPDLNMLALGTDLTTLGLHLNSPESLYTAFGSPWTERSLRREPDYHLPQCYYMQPPMQPPTSKLSLFYEETLFYIFYSMPKDCLQVTAAAELHARNWMFHKEHQRWFIRIQNTELQAKTATFERGSYHYFEPTTWEKLSKENFTLYYDQLEEPMKASLSSSPNNTTPLSSNPSSSSSSISGQPAGSLSQAFPPSQLNGHFPANNQAQAQNPQPQPPQHQSQPQTQPQPQSQPQSSQGNTQNPSQNTVPSLKTIAMNKLQGQQK